MVASDDYELDEIAMETRLVPPAYPDLHGN